MPDSAVSRAYSKLSGIPERLCRHLGQVPMRQAAVVIFVAALFSRCAIIFSLHLFELERSESFNVAAALATAGKFENPFTTAPTGPTAHVAPVYPLILSF